MIADKTKGQADESPQRSAIAGRQPRFRHLDLSDAGTALVRLPDSCQYFGIQSLSAGCSFEIRPPMSDEDWAAVVADDDPTPVDDDYAAQLGDGASYPGTKCMPGTVLVFSVAEGDLGTVTLVIEADAGADVDVFQPSDE